MPSLPVFASPSVARQRDPDSKRFRFKPGSVKPISGCWSSTCCAGINVRWLAVGFVLGMLIFATLSVLQVIMLDGEDGVFREAAPGWQQAEPGGQQQEAAEAQQGQQPEQPQEQAQEHKQQEAAETQQGQQPEQAQELPQEHQQQDAAGTQQEQQPEQPQEQPQGQQQAEQSEQQATEVQAAEQQEQQPEQPQEQPQGQQQAEQSDQQAIEVQTAEQQPVPATAMEQLHGLGIRYHEREPGTPAVGGYTFLPPGDWAAQRARRILIYLGANEGAELDYVIQHNSQRQRGYDLAFAFEARPDHNAAWELAVQQRSKPAVQYINKAVWWRDAVLDFGNRDQVGSVLRTKHNDFSDDSRTMQVQGIDFAAWVNDNIREDDKVTLVSDIQGAEFPVFAHLADSGLASRIDTLYMECHYMAHSNLIDAISEDSCRQLCQAVAPHVGQFFYWVGPNQEGGIVRGFEFVDKPGLQPGNCDALHAAVIAAPSR